MASPRGGSKEKTLASKREGQAGQSSIVVDNLLLILIAVRLLNALTIRTFFQPDEYYQALEPAWWLAFGEDKGAWVTWEWKHHLRSALHPALFAVTYRLADIVSSLLQIPPPIRAQVLLAAPKTIQAVCAAFSDYYTYKLAVQVYGKKSNASICALLLSVGSAWNWFVATRTFSNCLETTLTVIALYNWPFHWALGADEVGFQVDQDTLRIRQTHPQDVGRAEGQKENAVINETNRLRKCILCAGLATILRPTNIIIWVVLTLSTFGRGIWHHGMHWEIGAFVREGIVCGTSVLAFSALVDRLFYGVWTFPLWHFFKFNVIQSLAVFYGNNNWHYYISQGYPLLLTAAIPFAVTGISRAVRRRNISPLLTIQSRLILHRLALSSLALPAALSVLAHKEVRFICAILPALHILAAFPLSQTLGLSERIGSVHINHQRRPWTMLGIGFAVLLNLLLAVFVSRIHNSALTTVPDYLRQQFETYYVPQSEHDLLLEQSSTTVGKNLTFAVLMPCHSIPWRSHLQYPASNSTNGISGWALTCEPPLNLNATDKAAYLDEADLFYDNRASWLKINMDREIPVGSPQPGVYASQPSKQLHSSSITSEGLYFNEGEAVSAPAGSASSSTNKVAFRRAWPDYLVFFGQLEPFMRRYLAVSQYGECARFFNSFFHDDWRRTGDVVVWCVHPEQQTAKKHGDVKNEL